MNNPRENPRPETLTFSGMAALLLLVAAFCAYPFGAITPATLFAGIAFLCLSLATPGEDPDRAPARVRVPRAGESPVRRGPIVEAPDA